MPAYLDTCAAWTEKGPEMQSQPQRMGALEFNPRHPERTGLILRCCQEKELSLVRCQISSLVPLGSGWSGQGRRTGTVC